MKKIFTMVLVLSMILVCTALANSSTSAPILLSSENCVGWKVKETGNLKPMYISIGDVVVNNIIKYDQGGIGEDTIVINLSGDPVTIFAEYAAQEQAITTENFDLNELKAQLALQEFHRTEETKNGQRYAFDTLRFVVIDKDGKMLEDHFVTRTEFFNFAIFKTN